MFVVMSIIAGLMLLITSITSSLAAGNIYNSVTYANSNNARVAYQYLLIAAVLSWCALLLIIVILIVAVVTGGFTTMELSSEFLANPEPNKLDLIKSYKVHRNLASVGSTEIVIICVYISLALITAIIGILSLLAMIQIGKISNRDDKASSSYTNSIITIISSLATLILLIVAVISYFGMRTKRLEQYKQVDAFVVLAEERLGVNRIELDSVITVINK